MIKKFFLFTILLCTTIAYISSQDNSGKDLAGIKQKWSDAGAYIASKIGERNKTEEVKEVEVDKGDEEDKVAGNIINNLNNNKGLIFANLIAYSLFFLTKRNKPLNSIAYSLFFLIKRNKLFLNRCSDNLYLRYAYYVSR